jgi:hypothetical protein
MRFHPARETHLTTGTETVGLSVGTSAGTARPVCTVHGVQPTGPQHVPALTVGQVNVTPPYRTGATGGQVDARVR